MIPTNPASSSVPGAQPGLVVGIIGPVLRPQAVLVELADGRRVVTSPRLTAIEARHVAEAVGGALRPLTAGPQSLIHWLREPLPGAEIELATADRAARFLRIRSGD